MILRINYPEKLDIIHQFINFYYILLRDSWCWLLKAQDLLDTVSEYCPAQVRPDEASHRSTVKQGRGAVPWDILKIGFRRASMLIRNKIREGVSYFW